MASGGLDAYTGEPLEWILIGTYKNEDSKLGRHKYKAQFALLPAVDHHESDVAGTPFRMCAWRTNTAKNDLPIDAFIDLCRRVVAYHS